MKSILSTLNFISKIVNIVNNTGNQNSSIINIFKYFFFNHIITDVYFTTTTFYIIMYIS